jgi:predicted nucleotidyltransferase
MAAREIPPFLRRVVERYVRAFAPERIVLFGSYAKGSHHSGSDVDLLVIAPSTDEIGPHEQVRRARQLAADSFPPVDVVFATPEEVAGAAEAASPFLLSILGSGITLYARAPTSSVPARDLRGSTD